MITDTLQPLTSPAFYLPLGALNFDMNFLLVLIIPLAGMAVGAIAIIGGLIASDRNRRMRHETIRLALEKGQPIPPDLLEPSESEKASNRTQKKGRDDRRSGLVLIAISIGAYLFFRGVGGDGAQWLATIPGLIGVALLVNWFLDRADRNPPSSH